MRIGLLYQPRIEASAQHARRVQARLACDGHDAWVGSSWDIGDESEPIRDSDLLFTFGGDGTLLRAARAAAVYGVPCTGVNYGRVGFLTEIRAAEFDERLPEFLNRDHWVEERVLIDWTRSSPAGRVSGGLAAGDVVAGRGRMARVVEIEVLVDGALLTTYMADGVIVATPTGTTGYTQAAHGPVLHPECRELAVTPIAPFLTPANAMVLRAGSVIELVVHTTHEATLSIDGQTEELLDSGDRITCRMSEHLARFARVQPRGYFYATLADKLHWRVPREMPRPAAGPS